MNATSGAPAPANSAAASSAPNSSATGGEKSANLDDYNPFDKSQQKTSSGGGDAAVMPQDPPPRTATFRSVILLSFCPVVRGAGSR